MAVPILVGELPKACALFTKGSNNISRMPVKLGARLFFCAHAHDYGHNAQRVKRLAAEKFRLELLFVWYLPPVWCGLRRDQSALTIVFMDTKKPAHGAQDAVLDSNELATVRAAKREAKDLFGRVIGQRCREARGEMEIGVAAERLGVHRNTLSNIERGGSLPDAFDLDLMARVYGIAAEYLLTGQGQGRQETADEVAHATSAVRNGKFIYVPHFNVNASAGDGDVFNQLEMVKAMRPFDHNYIRGELGISHDELALISVVGNSMEPRLASGDTVLVDLRAGYELPSDGIHVVRLDEALLVKQIQRLPGKIFRIKSLNPEYEPFEIKTSEETDRDFAIIGRVIWGGITIK